MSVSQGNYYGSGRRKENPPPHMRKNFSGDDFNTTSRNRRMRYGKQGNGETFPFQGQPGTFGDPLRKGLGRNAMRWYHSLLDQGMSPEDARARAVANVEQKKYLNYDHNRPNKRTSESSPQSATDQKKRRGTSTIDVAILPKDQENNLSSSDLIELEEAIVEEIASGAECKLKFANIQYGPGMLEIECVDTESVNWLKEKSDKLSKWEGVELTVLVGEDIPKILVASIYFPKSKGKEEKELLTLINCQNEGLATHCWKIINSKDEVSGKKLTVGIDLKSAENIISAKNSLFYKFGKIWVNWLTKIENKVIEEKQTKVEDISVSAIQENSQLLDKEKSPIKETEGDARRGLDQNQLNLNIKEEEEDLLLKEEGEDMETSIQDY